MEYTKDIVFNIKYKKENLKLRKKQVYKKAFREKRRRLHFDVDNFS